jgi:hypothetical protein
VVGYAFFELWRSADLPDGLFGRLPVQPHLQKYFGFRPTQIRCISSLSRPTEGRFAIVTDVGNGMRWTRQHWARDVMQGGSIRPLSNRTACWTKDAEADGEVVWF